MFFVIILRPPRSTRLTHPFPYTTLFRSAATPGGLGQERSVLPAAGSGGVQTRQSQRDGDVLRHGSLRARDACRRDCGEHPRLPGTLILQPSPRAFLSGGMGLLSYAEHTLCAPSFLRSSTDWTVWSTRTFPSLNPWPATSSSRSRRSASTTPRCTCVEANGRKRAMLRRGGRSCLAGWLGGLDPILDFNPLLQMASRVYLTFFGSFVFGTPGFPLSDVPLQQIAEDAAAGRLRSEEHTSELQSL